VFFIAKITTNYHFTSCEARWYDDWSLSADQIHLSSVAKCALKCVESQGSLTIWMIKFLKIDGLVNADI